MKIGDNQRVFRCRNGSTVRAGDRYQYAATDVTGATDPTNRRDDAYHRPPGQRLLVHRRSERSDEFINPLSGDSLHTISVWINQAANFSHTTAIVAMGTASRPGTRIPPPACPPVTMGRPVAPGVRRGCSGLPVRGRRSVAAFIAGPRVRSACSSRAGLPAAPRPSAPARPPPRQRWHRMIPRNPKRLTRRAR
jgi:hypothetical protein